MAKQSCFIRMGATSFSVVVLFTQCLFAHKQQVNVWEERRAQPTQLASLPVGLTTPRFQTNNLINQLPSIAPSIPALPQWSGSNKKASAALPQSFRSLIDAIPLSAATIQYVYDSKDSAQSPLVLIQDVHLNAEAQTNIATVLQELINQKQVGLVGVEGAFAPFDFQPFRELDKKITKQVVDSYLKHDMLAAPSYVGIVSPVEPPAFVGVDDKPHYKANVAAYLSTRKTKESLLNRLREMKTNLADEKRKTFSAKLQAFDIAQTRYHEGEIGIGEYAKKLSFYAQDSLERNFSQDRRPGNLLAGAQVLSRKNPGLPAEALAKAGSRPKDVPGRRALERGRNLDLVMERFLAAYELETTLDFARVDQERRSVIEALVKTLTEKETATLVSQSVAYRMGQLGFGDYYQSLKSLAQSKGVNLARTPAFDNYIRYVLLSDGIKADKLFESLEQLEISVRDSLVSSPEEKTLLTESEHLMLATKLINFSLTPPEWERYKALSIDGLRLTGPFSSSLPISSPRNVFARGPGFSINNELHSFEQFYMHADIRSHLMLENLLTTNSNAQASNPKEYSNANKSIESLKLDDWKLRGPKVLVVGGFHAPEIAQLLRTKKISYVVVSPKITKIDTAAGSEYLSAFAREKTPLDKLFEGEKLFINPTASNVTYRPTAIRMLGGFWSRITSLVRVKFEYEERMVVLDVKVKNKNDATQDAVSVPWHKWFVFSVLSPLWETGVFHQIGLALTKNVLLWLGTTSVAASLGSLIVIAILFAGIHTVVKMKTVGLNWKRDLLVDFPIRFLLSFGFSVPFLSDWSYSLGWSFLIHSFYNSTVLAMRWAGRWSLVCGKIGRWLPLASIAGQEILTEDDYRKLYEDKMAELTVRRIITGNIEEEIAPDDAVQWLSGLRLEKITQAQDANTRGSALIYEFTGRYNVKISLLVYLNGGPGLVAMFPGELLHQEHQGLSSWSQFFTLPEHIEKVISEELRNIQSQTNIQVETSPQQWTFGRPFARGERKGQFQGFLSHYPLVSRFVKLWLDRGVKVFITRRFTVSRAREIGAHFSSFHGSINMVGSPSYTIFAHEFAHAVFD